MRTSAVFAGAAAGTIVALGLGFGVVNAGPIQQVTVNATQDSYVSVASPTTNYGSATTLRQTSGWSTTMEWMYLDFGNLMISIPSGAAVYQAQVLLDRLSETGATNSRVGHVNAAWSESTITYSTMPGESQNYYRPTFGTGTTIPVDVTAFVETVARAGSGIGSFRFTGGGEDSHQTTVFNSREAGAATGPRLAVKYITADKFLPTAGERAVRLQQGLSGYTGTVDTYISSRDVSTDHGSATTVSLMENTWGGNVSRGLFKFDVTSIPAQTKITQAMLTLQPGSFQTSASAPVQAYEALRPWTAAATFATYDGASAWQTAGALGALDQSAAVAVTTIQDSAWGSVYLDVTTSVQKWVNGTATNNGWLVDVFSATQNIMYGVPTSENAYAAWRPQLWIIYPEPASLMLLACGGLLALRRRR